MDIGCDDGSFSLLMGHAINSNEIHGIEIVQSQVALARKPGLIVEEVNLESAALPYRDNFFDCVVANQVIEHIHNVEGFVSEIKRVLVLGGVAIISTENLASWHNIFALLMGWQPFSATNLLPGKSLGNPLSLHKHRQDSVPASWCHDKVMAYGALKDLFIDAGFKIRSVVGSGYYPFPYYSGNIDIRHCHWITFIIEKINNFFHLNY